MRKIYILAAVSFVLSVLIFLSSFVYLDKAGHGTHYYIVNLNGHDIGTIRVDEFSTEDAFIYKSTAEMPFEPLFTEYKAKIGLDKKYGIEDYSKDRAANGATELSYLKNKDDRISFISRFQAQFISINNIPIQKEAFVFEEDSPATYLPILKNYDFKRGRSQGFNAITCFPDPGLPPMKRYVTLTSIKDGYIKIGSKAIRAENLLLKIRNYPQGSVWVAKSDKSLLRVDIPQKGLSITSAFRPKMLSVEKYVSAGDEYTSKNISFKNKNIEIAGTLTVPKKEGHFPGILLVWGEGPQDRDYQGLFSSLADYLSNNGFCVLRIDKRGIGSSGGDYPSYTIGDETEDLNKALEYLTSQKEVDRQRVAIIGHSEGAYYALKVASLNNGVKGTVLMSPSVYLESWDDERIECLKILASKAKWTEEYLKRAERAVIETVSIARTSQSDWYYILGERVFLKNIRDRLSEKPIELIKNMKEPVLILQGKEDESGSTEIAEKLDKVLADNGNPSHTITYYGYLGHFLGKESSDGIHRNHYDMDKEVLLNIKNWLNAKLAPPVESAAPVEPK